MRYPCVRPLPWTALTFLRKFNGLGLWKTEITLAMTHIDVQVLVVYVVVVNVGKCQPGRMTVRWCYRCIWIYAKKRHYGKINACRAFVCLSSFYDVPWTCNTLLCRSHKQLSRTIAKNYLHYPSAYSNISLR